MRSRRYDVPPLDQLLAFEAAARNLSFTRAGEELFLSQSAVSRQIQALETDLGTRLFERKTRALALTEDGHALFRVTQGVLQSLHDSAQRLRHAAGSRMVTVTTTPGFAALWLIPRLATFTRDHPGIDVRLSTGHELVNLERAGVDLAIRYGPEEQAEGHVTLFGETVFPVCAPALRDNPMCPLRTPEDLREQVLLYMDDTRTAWLDWDLWFHALGLRDFHPAGRLHFSHYDQLIHAAVAGQGVALGRDPLLRDLLRDGQLVTPFQRDAVSSRTYYLVESLATRMTDHVKACKSWVIEAARAESPATSAPLESRG